jgi:ribosome biogenesis protein NSA1
LSNIFKGKNVKNDKLDLQVPIHITDIKFLSAGDDKGHRFATSTKFGQIRIYDTTKGRRPTQDIQVTPNGIKLLADAAEETDVIYSDTHMTTALFSLDRKQTRGNFAGFTGSTQGVHSYEGRLLAAGGWDRYLRVFDLKSREPVAKIFTGCEISAVVILEDDIRKREIEDDDLWDELDSATTKSRSKKQKVTKA